MKKISTKQIIIIAMLIAFDVIFSRVVAVNVLTFKIGIGFAAIAVCAMLYGPLWAGIAAAVSDVIGSLIFATGMYFPGFTVTAALTGVIFGLFLYKERPRFRQCFFAALINCSLVTLFLNTLMIALLFSQKGFWALFTLRLGEFAVMLVLQTAITAALSSSNALYGKINELKNE